jgi:hydroxymethylglutaryl-CoA synthase
MYTPSLYGCLVSYLLNTNEDNLYSSRIILFSYGSGFASSMFSIVVSDVNKCQENRFTLRKILNNLSKVKTNLDNRIEIIPKFYDKYLQHREVVNKKGLLKRNYSLLFV